jgi:hypothetical protein
MTRKVDEGDSRIVLQETVRANAIADLARDLAIAAMSSGKGINVDAVFIEAEKMIDKMIAIGAEL